MKFSRVYVSDFNCISDIEDVIDKIRSDFSNYAGGRDGWFSDCEAILLKGAKAKIEQLERKQYRIAKTTCGINALCQGCLYCYSDDGQ